jgi:hypothetical protein
MKLGVYVYDPRSLETIATSTSHPLRRKQRGK